MEDKKLLLGNYIIVNEGDFKGVTGFLKSIDIEVTQNVERNSQNKELMTFTQKENAECRVIVNAKNTIIISLESLSKIK